MMRTDKTAPIIGISISWSRVARQKLSSFLAPPVPLREDLAQTISSEKDSSVSTQPKIAPTKSPAKTPILSAQNVSAQMVQVIPLQKVSVRVLNAVARRAICATIAAIEREESSTRLANGNGFEVALSFVDDEEMHAMNAQYRGKNKPTDVLSFAQNEGENFPTFQENAATVLGDVVISIETAQRQAQERAHSLSYEVAFLAVHGTLHLLGFDHVFAKDRRVMFRAQDAIMAKLDEL